MLIGHYPGILSLKRRVAIPKKFRQELGEQIIVARWYEECLIIISNLNWQALLNKLTGKAQVVTAPVRDTDRFILGSAFELEPDDQGWVIIPASLAGYAHLESDLVFIGLGDRVEIWNRAEWLKRENYIARHAGELVEKLASKREKDA